MTPLLRTVEEFAFPRFPGTEGERQAAQRIAARFTQLGLHVTREPFRTSRSAVFRFRAIVHGIAAVCLLAMGIAAPTLPGAALTCGMVMILLAARAGSWPQVIERGFDVGTIISSENVMGVRAGKGPNPHRLVFMAHYDSKSARWPTFVPVALILLAIGISVAMTVVAGLSVVAGDSPPAPQVSIPMAMLGALALTGAVLNTSGNESPGAMDNASGLSVLLELARQIPNDEVVKDFELVFLATGAEEIGLAGSLRWIQKHGSELDRSRTAFINLDSVGVGQGLIALDARGQAPSGASMKEAVRTAARARGVALRVLPFLPGVGVDTMPIGARGFATVTILGQVLSGASRRIHTPRDTLEHLNENGLRQAVQVCGEIAREIGRSRKD